MWARATEAPTQSSQRQSFTLDWPYMSWRPHYIKMFKCPPPDSTAHRRKDITNRIGRKYGSRAQLPSCGSTDPPSFRLGHYESIFAREEALRNTVEQLQRYNSHIMRSLQEATAVHRQDKYVIGHLRDENVRWQACYQASQDEQKALLDELSREKNEHLAHVTTLQEEIDRRRELETYLEQASEGHSVASEEENQQTHLILRIGISFKKKTNRGARDVCESTSVPGQQQDYTENGSNLACLNDEDTMMQMPSQTLPRDNEILLLSIPVSLEPRFTPLDANDGKSNTQNYPHGLPNFSSEGQYMNPGSSGPENQDQRYYSPSYWSTLPFQQSTSGPVNFGNGSTGWIPLSMMPSSYGSSPLLDPYGAYTQSQMDSEPLHTKVTPWFFCHFYNIEIIYNVKVSLQAASAFSPPKEIADFICFNQMWGGHPPNFIGPMRIRQMVQLRAEEGAKPETATLGRIGTRPLQLASGS
ncbi:hypothetical protein ACJ73_01126 [Blastomyces percursus]|uniref:Uncharacterized protein n=1 Tax=Blastomyces percursus TaxID=1658174 RepID=A0A1J9RFX9_9EURO|nr:hypothetical protein ACJ73_01126 [Blastomyces percursus]